MIVEVTVLMLSGRQIGGRLDVASVPELEDLMADRGGTIRLAGREVVLAFVQDWHYRRITPHDGPGV